MFPMKEQAKTPEKDINKTEISDLPDKKFKIIIIKLLTRVRGTIHEQSKNVNKKRKYRKYQKKSQGKEFNYRAEKFNKEI